MLVIAFLGNDMVDLDAFNSLHTAGTIIITRNMVCIYTTCACNLPCTVNVIPGIHQNLERISGFRGLRQIRNLQLSHNPQLISIDGFSRTVDDMFSINNIYINNNPRLCYVLNELSDREYWMVSSQLTQNVECSSLLYISSTSHILNLPCSYLNLCLSSHTDVQ